jgi:hypothetical protein
VAVPVLALTTALALVLHAVDRRTPSRPGADPELAPLPLFAQVRGLAAMAVGVTKLARLGDDDLQSVPGRTQELEEVA